MVVLSTVRVATTLVKVEENAWHNPPISRIWRYRVSFLPREAVPARGIIMLSLCLSVCMPVPHRNGWTDRAAWVLTWKLPSTHRALYYYKELRVFPEMKVLLISGPREICPNFWLLYSKVAGATSSNTDHYSTELYILSSFVCFFVAVIGHI